MRAGLLGQGERTRVSGISVVLESVFAFGDSKVIFGDDLVEGVGTASEGLAGVAVAVYGKDGQRV